MLTDVLKTVGELTLRVLWRFTSLLETSLLAFYGAGIASQEACFFQRATIILAVNFVECTGNAQAHGAGLAGRSTTVNQRNDVVCAVKLENTKWIVNFLLVQFIREV